MKIGKSCVFPILSAKDRGVRHLNGECRMRNSESGRWTEAGAGGVVRSGSCRLTVAEVQVGWLRTVQTSSLNFRQAARSVLRA